jgi:hypothetical protein
MIIVTIWKSILYSPPNAAMTTRQTILKNINPRVCKTAGLDEEKKYVPWDCKYTTTCEEMKMKQNNN